MASGVGISSACAPQAESVQLIVGNPQSDSRRARTGDLPLTRRLLSLLSYPSKSRVARRVRVAVFPAVGRISSRLAPLNRVTSYSIASSLRRVLASVRSYTVSARYRRSTRRPNRVGLLAGQQYDVSGPFRVRTPDALYPVHTASDRRSALRRTLQRSQPCSTTTETSASFVSSDSLCATYGALYDAPKQFPGRVL